MKTLNTTYLLLLGLIMLFVLNCGADPQASTLESENEGWLGVDVQDLDKELRRYFDIDARHGVVITDIVTDSPADKSGLREEDLITRFDGTRIQDSEDLRLAVRSTAPGKRVKVQIERDNDKKTLRVRVGERQEITGREFDKVPEPPAIIGSRRAWLGVEIAKLNDDLADYFDLEEGEGVLVLSVIEDSPAEEAGIRAGDVLQKLAGRRLRDPDDLLNTLAGYKSGDEVEIELKRKGRDLKLDVELQKSRHTGWHLDRDDWQKWHRGMNDWKEHFKRQHLEELQHELHKNLRHLEDIEIHVDLQELQEEIGADMESLSEELREELSDLAEELEELEDIEIRIDLEQPEDTI